MVSLFCFIIKFFLLLGIVETIQERKGDFCEIDCFKQHFWKRKFMFKIAKYQVHFSCRSNDYSQNMKSLSQGFSNVPGDLTQWSPPVLFESITSGIQHKKVKKCVS